MPEFMEGTADVPGIGKIKKRYIMIPAGLAGVYVAYRWYQVSRGEGGPAPGADGLYSSDDLSEYGLSTTGGPTTVTGNTGSTVTDGTTPGAIDTNAEWTERAVESLTNQGYDGQTVLAALGDFLARHSLDKTEASIAHAALAVAGQPPVGGPYSVIDAAAEGPVSLAAPTGLKVDSVTATAVKLSWTKVNGAGLYRVYRSGASFNIGATDAANSSITIDGLTPNTEYTFYVAADTTTGKPGPKSAGAKAKTKSVSLAKPTGLKASAITKSSFRVTAGPVKGATFYRWYFKGATGSWRASGASDQPYRDFTGLSANSSYQVKVSADTSGQTPGPESAALTVKTKK